MEPRNLAAIDALATQGDVEETMLVHHMGHNGERSRGGSVFRGWPDAEWRLLREEVKPGHQPPPDGPRFFSAEGRDVTLHEMTSCTHPVTAPRFFSIRSLVVGPSTAMFATQETMMWPRAFSV